MTYAKKFGKFGIYTDGTLYKWFKDLENAEEYWDKNVFGDGKCAEEFLEDYDEVTMVDMKSGQILHDLTDEVNLLHRA